MLGTRLAASASAGIQTAMGILYLPQVPESLIRRPIRPGQDTAVVFIESLGPVWSVVFWASAMALIVATIRGRGFINGHLAAMGVCMFYGSCVIYSAIFAEPPAPIVVGVLGVGVALLNLAIAIGCRDRGHR
jgi:hypothetical protein